MLVVVFNNFSLQSQDIGTKGLALVLQLPKWRLPPSIAWIALKPSCRASRRTEPHYGRMEIVFETIFDSARLKRSQHPKPPFLFSVREWVGSLPRDSVERERRNYSMVLGREEQIPTKVRQKNSWVDSGSGNLPSE
jgi:hypothetical protein